MQNITWKKPQASQPHRGLNKPSRRQSKTFFQQLPGLNGRRRILVEGWRYKKKKTHFSLHGFRRQRNRATLRAENCRKCSPSALRTPNGNLSKCAATLKGVQRRLAVGQGPDSLLTQTSFAAKGGPIKY